MSYGGGLLEFRGPYYEDDVSVGDITAQNFQFVVNTEGKGVFNNYGAAGIFGLCYCPSKEKKNSSSFFENLLTQGKVKEPEFGLFIGRNNEPGELTLGGYDAGKFKGPITTVPVISQGVWNIRVDGAYMNGKPIRSSAGNCNYLASHFRESS